MEPIDPDRSRAWAEVDLAALRRNASAIGARARVPLLPMVKADAYGLGAAAIARALEPLSPWGFGVATLDEARVLHQAGITRPVLLFTPLLPGQAGACRAEGVRPCIGDSEALSAWLELGDAPFHLEIDTGMGRAGVPYDDREVLSRLAELLRSAAGWEGVFTHFHSADTDPASARLQWRRLLDTVTALGRRPRWIHAASSAGVLTDPDLSGDFARPGIYLYGGQAGIHCPEPVVRFRARVVAVRRIAPGSTVSYGASWAAPKAATIATISAGYADGLHRSLSARGRVELAGAAHPIAGRVTMDLTMVDVGDTPVRPGDVATIFGGVVTLDQQAEAAGTISYELLTAIGPRVKRIYLDGGTD